MALDSFQSTGLPKSLVESLSALNLIPLEVLFSNPRKGRWTLKVIEPADSYSFVLKWCHPDAIEEAKIGFLKEIEFYSLYGHLGITPKLVKFSKEFLLLEYVNSITLLDFLENNITQLSFEELKTLLSSLFTQMGKVASLSQGVISLQESVDDLISFWGKMLTSGPMKTSRPKLEEVISKLFVRIFRRPVRNRLISLLSKSFDDENIIVRNMLHGDLHLNNIMVIKSSLDVIMIDFENYKKNRYWMPDFFYIWSLLSVYLCDVKYGEKDYFDILRYFELFNKKEEVLFVQLSNLGVSAVSINSRFNPYLTVWKRPLAFLSSFFFHLCFCFKPWSSYNDHI